MRSQFGYLVFLTAVLDMVDALVVVLDPQGRIVRFNRACEQTTGYSFEEVRDRYFWDLFLIPEEIKSVQIVFEELRTAHFQKQHENYCVTKDGDRRLITWSETFLQDDDGLITHVIATGVDITELRRAMNALRESEAALRRSQEELRSLTGRLISAREEESRHLAREMHDVLSQRLALLGMEVSALHQVASLPSSLTDRLRLMGDEIGRLAQDVHQLSRRLHPSILDDLGLTATLRAECAAFSKQHGIPTEFASHNVPESLPSDISLGLYRIAQESLWNAAKHAEAKVILVTLTGAGKEIVLAIDDDGNGFDLEQVRGKSGLGLVSMEERVRLVNGRFSVTSELGKGTSVEVRIPLSRK